MLIHVSKRGPKDPFSHNTTLAECMGNIDHDNVDNITFNLNKWFTILVHIPDVFFLWLGEVSDIVSI